MITQLLQTRNAGGGMPTTRWSLVQAAGGDATGRWNPLNHALLIYASENGVRTVGLTRW
jgi:hypothetical protein